MHLLHGSAGSLWVAQAWLQRSGLLCLQAATQRGLHCAVAAAAAAVGCGPQQAVRLYSGCTVDALDGSWSATLTD